jgi:hypothetical protein
MGVLNKYCIIIVYIRSGWQKIYDVQKTKIGKQKRLRLDRYTALYIYKAKNSKLLAVLNHAHKKKKKIIFK